MTKPDEPVLYYLQGDDAPQPGFVREELLAVLSDTQLPPDGVLGFEHCVTSLSVALETGQSGVVAGVTHGIV